MNAGRSKKVKDDGDVDEDEALEAEATSNTLNTLDGITPYDEPESASDQGVRAKDPKKLDRVTDFRSLIEVTHGKRAGAPTLLSAEKACERTSVSTVSDNPQNPL